MLGIEGKPLSAEVGVVPLLAELHDVLPVLFLELLEGEGGFAAREFARSPPPIENIEQAVDLVERVVRVLVPEFAVDEPIEGGAGDLDEAVLNALESAGGKQGHPKLQELIVVQSMDHDVEAADEVVEIAVDPVDPLEERRCVDVGLRVDLIDFQQRQLEVQLRDLVVHHEDLLVREGGHRLLQAQEGVQVDVIPIRWEIRVQQAVEIGRQVLAHGGVFVLELLEAIEDTRIEGVGFGHAGKLRPDGGPLCARRHTSILD